MVKPSYLVGMAIGAGAIVPMLSFAAGADLYNGGLGQSAGNPAQFGVALCNDGSASVAQGVPIAVSANNQNITTSSSASVDPGDCTYTYLAYSAFGMQPSQTYSVAVTIDPAGSVISNSNNQATYSVTVPANAIGSTGSSSSQTSFNASASAATQIIANINVQLGSLLGNFVGWIRSLL